MRVPRTIGFAKFAGARSAIQNECGLQTLIPEVVVEMASGARLVEGQGNLDMEISQVHAPGGWVFSGPKWLEVRGSLRQGGKTVGTFRAKRFSMDPTAGGVCGMLAKCGRNIAMDIAQWLQNPTMNAEIGDAK